MDLHFWGELCIITDKNGNQYRFDKKQTNILELCNGSIKVKDVILEIVNRYNGNYEEIEQAKVVLYTFINTSIRKKFLEIKDDMFELDTIESKFSGERGKYYPYSITIEITSKCNFSCSFCYKSATNKGEDLDNRILNKILALKGKVKEIRFLGGEPFLYPNFSEVLKKFSPYFRIGVVSNGSTLYKFDEDILLNIDRLQLSIYGYSNETYKQNTGAELGLEHFRKSVEKVNKIKLPYKICLTLGKDSIPLMEDYVKSAIKINAVEINFGMPALVGGAISKEDSKNTYNFEKSDIKSVYYKMREIKLKYKDQIKVVVWQHSSLQKENAEVMFEQCTNCLECGGGWYSLVLSEKGMIRPCELLPEDIFSYGDYNVIENIANNGYFYLNELREMTNRYKKSLNIENIELNKICFALDKI